MVDSQEQPNDYYKDTYLNFQNINNDVPEAPRNLVDVLSSIDGRHKATSKSGMHIDKPVMINISPEANAVEREQYLLEEKIREHKRQLHFQTAQRIKDERKRLEQERLLAEQQRLREEAERLVREHEIEMIRKAKQDVKVALADVDNAKSKEELNLAVERLKKKLNNPLVQDNSEPLKE